MRKSATITALEEKMLPIRTNDEEISNKNKKKKALICLFLITMLILLALFTVKHWPPYLIDPAPILGIVS